MATPDWLAATEQIIGASHPTRANTKDRCGQTIQAMLEVEHSESGVHDARSTGLSGEIGTFSGNGAARTISLTNTGLTPKKVYVWEAIDTTERVTNGGFPADTTGWTPSGCTLASIAGGQAGNCCELTKTGNPQYFTQDITTIIGHRYTLSVYVKSGSSGDEEGYFGVLGGETQAFNTTAAWVQHTKQLIATSTTTTLYFSKNTLTAGTMLFDTISCQEAIGADIIRIDEMASEKSQISRYYSSTWTANIIDNFQAGSFDVGATHCNTNGRTNYFLVLGIDTDTVPTGDTGAGSDPTWITSSTLNRIIADDSAVVSSDNIANSVESEIWTEFIEEHTVAGVHSVTLQHVRIETIDWTGNDADDRVISCNITDLDIMDIEVYSSTAPVASKTTDMAGDTTKDEDAAAFAADMIQDITTNGQFTVGTLLNASGSTYVACLIGV